MVPTMSLPHATLPLLAEPIITLVDGLLMGEHTVAQAMTHGDTGLGTLDLLDGEVVVYQGIAYHQSADGTCHVLTGNEVTPFMTVTTWDQDKTVSFKLEQDMDYTALQAFMRKSVFRSGNGAERVQVGNGRGRGAVEGEQGKGESEAGA